MCMDVNKSGSESQAVGVQGFSGPAWQAMTDVAYAVAANGHLHQFGFGSAAVKNAYITKV